MTRRAGSDLQMLGPQDTPRFPSFSREVLSAARVRAEEHRQRVECDSQTVASMADAIEARPRGKLPRAQARIGAGRELVETRAAGGPAGRCDTLASPDYVAADASRARLELADQAGCLELALDTSDSIEAADSVERMLAHQLAAAHSVSMKLSARAAMHSDRAAQDRFSLGGRPDFHAVEAARAANAAARLMEAFQRGTAALQRLRTRGEQIVTVQHVHVGDGGQAVVAGKVTGGGAGRRRQGGGGSKNGA